MLRQQITDDLKTAMKAGDTNARDTLRMLDSMIKNEEIAQSAREEGLDEAGITTLIKRAIKQRRDAAKQYADAGRPELAQQEESEVAVLAKYLPEQMNDDELRSIIAGVMEEVGGADASKMGQIMGASMKAVGDKADGGAVKRIVGELLK